MLSLKACANTPEATWPTCPGWHHSQRAGSPPASTRNQEMSYRIGVVVPDFNPSGFWRQASRSFVNSKSVWSAVWSKNSQVYTERFYVKNKTKKLETLPIALYTSLVGQFEIRFLCCPGTSSVE